MYLIGNLLVFLAVALSCIWSLPQLQDNGYHFLKNPPSYIEDTTPTFQNSARFVLVLDCSNSMAQHEKMDHLKTTSIRWIRQLKAGTQIAIVKFGTSGSILNSWVEIDEGLSGLIHSINGIQANGGGSCMACGLKMAEELMLDSTSPGHAGVVMTVTGSESNDGTDVGDESVWGPFKRSSIRVTTILMGTRKDADIETLARETKGKVFTVNYDGSDLDGPFDWASQTYIPSEVGDGYEWLIEEVIMTGRDAIHCNFQCMDVGMTLDDETNKDVVISFRISEHGSNPLIMDYFESVNVKDEVTGDIVDGYTFSVDEQRNQVILRHPHPEAGTYVIGITFKRRIGITFMLQVKVIGHRSSPSSEPYMVECQYPDEIIHIESEVQKFLIIGVVKQGQTTVKGATLYARISKSMDEDSAGEEDPCFVELMDDGNQQISGDVIMLDGVHSNILDPRNCFRTPPLNGQRMQVMCTMVSSPDTQITDNNFFSKKVDAKGSGKDLGTIRR